MKLSSDVIEEELKKLFPNAKCELNYSKDYELLLSVMLSAQTTDKRVNEVTKKIYNEYNTLEKLSKLTVKDIEDKIKSIGFHHTKAKNFKCIINTLLETTKVVPNDREKLESMPGVGRKTASVVLAELYNIPSVAVDTHVFRVSKRLGITKENDDLLETENKIKKYFKKEKWNKINSSLVLFGRYICTSKKPKCNNCPFNNKCEVTK